jgi:hypothetical protein
LEIGLFTTNSNGWNSGRSHFWIRQYTSLDPVKLNCPLLVAGGEKPAQMVLQTRKVSRSNEWEISFWNRRIDFVIWFSNGRNWKGLYSPRPWEIRQWFGM